ncbi:D-amino-acid transaminase [Rhizobium sp. Leaf341]|uniref:D-amino-acid transaminase n=1 Tax=Rhizobium sp. Leaf341 TaxID=1736344 RepID=UPI000715EB84|nr:D-amino-acid transaminase [Rhizobium sp. Leaf341]KQR73177.1 D-amino acid aminotransferase [Rhizobium sp. Leaf341]
MNRIVYLDGTWLEEADAKVSVFDRGFLFADAVYEVTAVIGGKLIDYAGHAARLQRSLRELALSCPLGPDALLSLHHDIVARNALDEGLIYLQISRGAADRDFIFSETAKPTLVLFTQAKAVLDNPYNVTGIKVVTLPDQRWARRDIKTVQLLYPSMAKMEALRQGAQDAWLVEDGFVTEATSANAHIVTAEGTLVTRPLSHAILPGITRATIVELARAAGMPVEERAFTPDEARQASEAFITSATNFALPVTMIDGVPVGNGKPGPITERMRALYIAERLSHAEPVT